MNIHLTNAHSEVQHTHSQDFAPQPLPLANSAQEHVCLKQRLLSSVWYLDFILNSVCKYHCITYFVMDRGSIQRGAGPIGQAWITVSILRTIVQLSQTSPSLCFHFQLSYFPFSFFFFLFFYICGMIALLYRPVIKTALWNIEYPSYLQISCWNISVDARWFSWLTYLDPLLEVISKPGLCLHWDFSH